MTAVNKFGNDRLQLAEEGALAYQSSFDLTKTEVSKAPVDSFIRAYEKAVAGLPPEHAPEFMEAMKKPWDASLSWKQGTSSSSSRAP